MSSTIDERVVEMRFDNQEFESNVKTSLSTIDRLKQSLNFNGATTGLENIGSAAKNCNMSVLGEAVQAVSSKFSAFSVMGITALANLTNSAVNAGKKIVSALTIDPVKSGFQEYETQINAVQTILANTQNGVTKVNQKAIDAIKETAAANTEATKQANEEALTNFKEAQSEELSDFKKTQSKKLEAYNEAANEELDVLKNKYDKESSDLEKALNDELTALTDAHNEKLTMYDEEYKEKLKLVDEEKYNKLQAIDDEITSIQNLTKAEEEEIEKQEQEAKLSKLQAAVSSAKDADTRKKAEEELQTYKDKLARDELLKERNNKITALKESKNNIEEEYKAKEDSLTQEYTEKANQETELYTEKYNNISDEYNQKQSEMQASYSEELALLQARQAYEKEAFEEQQAAELKAFQKQQTVKLANLKEEQTIALANIEERKNAEISALNASAKASKGSTLEDVNAALDELNTYADKTIYNFTEMTRNIGTFTAAGIDLDTSVAAIKGIANLAAVSGSTSQQASTAMYQLSQALASGTVKLQDWNSVVNAGMGGQVFQDALKETARVHGIAIDQMISQEGSFRETLSKGWLTSDILTETLSKFTGDLTKEQIKAMGYTDEQTESIIKMGETANDAATKVKTFTQLFDTLAEAAQSGWTQSWETIIGDFEEAKELLTSVSDVLSNLIQASADARNAILSDWKALGGRTKLIDAVRNAFNGVLSIITPVKEAFSDIFPPITGQQLADLSSKIEEITAKFIISDETADKVYRTFAGLFAIFDIGKEAAKALFDAVSPLITSLTGYSDGILDTTAKMGDWLVKLDETIKKNETFKVTIENVVDFVQSIPDKLNTVFQKITGVSIGDAFDTISQKASDALQTLKDVFSGFGEIDTSGVTTLSDNAEKRFQPLTKLFEGLKKVFEGIWKLFKKLSPIFASLFSVFGDIADGVGEAVSDFAKNADYNSILDVFNSGVLAAIALGLKKFIDSLTEVTDSASGILGKIKGIFGGVQECLQAYQENLKSDILIKIAKAVGILTASVLVLSLIDSEKLSASLAAMTAEFIDLVVAMKMLDGSMSGSSVKDVGKLATTMIAVSSAVLILSFAMKNVAELDWDQIAKGSVAIATLSLIMVTVAKGMSENSDKLMSGALGLVVFAQAIKMLVPPVKELGEMDTNKLFQGLAGVSTLVFGLAAFLQGAKLDDMSLGKGLGLMALAVAINILATVVGKFGEMDTNKMLQGLGGVIVVLSALAVFVRSTGDASAVISTSTGMLILSAAMLVFSKAVESMGNLSLEQIAKGLGTMIVALSTMVFAVNSVDSSRMLEVSTGILLISTALKIMASALLDFGNMSLEEIAKALGVMIVSLSAIAVAVNAMGSSTTSALNGAAAIVIVATAINMLVPALQSLGSMSLNEITLALISLAGTFTVIGIAGMYLGPIIPAILGLAAAVALLGVGTLACGAGLLSLSAGLTSLGAAGAAGVAALILGIEAILGLLPTIIIKIAEGIVNLIVAIGNDAPRIIEAFVKVAKSVLAAIGELAPDIVELAVTLLDKLLKTLADHMPSIVKSGMSILKSLLKGIKENISDITTTMIDILTEMLEAIAKKIPDIIQSGIDIVVALIDGLAKGIEDNTERIRNSLLGLFKSLLKSALEFWGIHSPSTVFSDMGDNLMQGLINGMVGLFSTAWNNLKEFCSNLVSTVSNKASEFKEKGKEIATKLKEGIVNGVPEVIKALVKGVTDAIEKVKEKIATIKEVGKNLAEGLKNGLKEAKDKVVEEAEKLGNDVIDAAKEVFGIHSPSKAFAEIGGFIDKGLIQGLDKYSSNVSDATEELGETAIGSMSGAIAKIADMLNSDMDTQPTITPVLDLTNVVSGIGTINKSLNANRSIELAARTSIASGSLFANNQNGVLVDNSEVVGAIGQLRGDVSSLSQAMSKMKIVMDSGTVVGEIAPQMDKALGARSVYRERWS